MKVWKEFLVEEQVSLTAVYESSYNYQEEHGKYLGKLTVSKQFWLICFW